jgi:conserved oligomeric Golgi complex subunit 4
MPTSYPATHEEGMVDPREIDKVLTEVAGMSGRWSLFKRFLIDSPKVRDLCRYQTLTLDLTTWQDQPLVSDEADPSSKSPTADFTDSALKLIDRDNSGPTGFESIQSTTSQQLLENLLTTYYVPLEVWYTRTIIEKA